MLRFTLALALVGCTQTVPQKPTSPTSRGMRADAHRDAARDHEHRAEELARWPEANRTGIGTSPDPSSGLWYRAWDQTGDHDRIAMTHRGAAAQLQAAYDEACAVIPAEHIRTSPLARYGEGGMPIEDGVVVFMAAGASSPDRLLAELRCHRAWMMLAQDPSMDTCPLDLPDLRIEAHGDKQGMSVELHVGDHALVPELQRRTARDLELSRSTR